jgi:hypothetical protein
MHKNNTGANPAITSCNASRVKIYNATNSRQGTKTQALYIVVNSTVVGRISSRFSFWLCCKFAKSTKIELLQVSKFKIPQSSNYLSRANNHTFLAYATIDLKLSLQLRCTIYLHSLHTRFAQP